MALFKIWIFNNAIVELQVYCFLIGSIYALKAENNMTCYGDLEIKDFGFRENNLQKNRTPSQRRSYKNTKVFMMLINIITEIAGKVSNN